eukprot:4079960-Pyramimonas_sp.AAC.1
MSLAKRLFFSEFVEDVSSETLALCYRLSSPGDLNSEDVSSGLLVFTCPGLKDVSSETLGFTPPGDPDRCLACGFVEDVSNQRLVFTCPGRTGGCLA